MTPGSKKTVMNDVTAMKDTVKDFNKSWSMLIGYMGKYKKWFLFATLLSFTSTIAMLILPHILESMIDLIEEGIGEHYMDMGPIVDIAIRLSILGVITIVLSVSEYFILSTVTQRITAKLRSDILRKINRLPLNYIDRAATGDILSRVTNDADTVGQSLNRGTSTIITNLTMLIGSTFMMFYTNTPMAVVAVLTTTFGIVSMGVIVSKTQKYFNAQQADLGMMNGLVEETYTGYLTVRAYSGEDEAKSEFDQINENLRTSALVSQFLGGSTQPLMAFFGNLGYVAVCIMGAILVMEGVIGFGVIVAFVMYIKFFADGMSGVSQSVYTLQSVAAATNRIFVILKEEEMSDEESSIQKLTNVKGAVEFRDVRFGYTTDREIIRGFSVKIQPGQKVAIVGNTGSGKTTIINLLMRFYEMDSGDILIDGISIKDMSRECVHDLFCMVLQDTWLFEGTLRENLVYNKKGVTDEELDAICESIDLKKYVDSLPERYDTKLTNNAAISAGQRQQITIARAMIDNSPLLIMDEATSSIDTRTEKLIQKAMNDMSRNRTSFIIAHRLSTIRDADMILVLNKGTIIEHGTHDELLSRKGPYYELYNSQFMTEGNV